jgi:DNA-directed RNA polymerase alpha subunit
MTDTGAIPKSAPRLRRTDDGWMRSILRGQKFEGRGFSKRTVDALLAHGISALERLLFMTETELQNISGIGASSLAEILRYRKQHLSGA